MSIYNGLQLATSIKKVTVAIVYDFYLKYTKERSAYDI